jgi:hypothetical protein
MKTIYKYSINDSVPVPEHFKVLTAAFQGGDPYIWIELDPNREAKMQVQFSIFGTGGELPENPGIYLNTVFQNEFVWHIYYQVVPIE